MESPSNFLIVGFGRNWSEQQRRLSYSLSTVGGLPDFVASATSCEKGLSFFETGIKVPEKWPVVK